MRCPRCGYEWKPRVPNPRECPRCKARLDYPSKRLRAPAPIPEVKEIKEIKRKEVRKGMSQKLPWVAAAIIIIGVAAVGAWALSRPTVPPTPSTPAPGVPGTSMDSWSANLWGSGVVPSELWSANIYPSQGTVSAVWSTVIQKA